jgi:hypothetical protein
MSDDLGWPAWIQIDPETFEIHSPPVILREFAGTYGQSRLIPLSPVSQDVVSGGCGAPNVSVVRPEQSP